MASMSERSYTTKETKLQAFSLKKKKKKISGGLPGLKPARAWTGLLLKPDRR